MGVRPGITRIQLSILRCAQGDHVERERLRVRSEDVSRPASDFGRSRGVERGKADLGFRKWPEPHGWRNGRELQTVLRPKSLVCGADRTAFLVCERRKRV